MLKQSDLQEVKPYKNAQTKKEQVEKMFDNIAPTYNFLNHFLSLGIDKGWRNKVVRILNTNKPKKILDIATGTGDLSFAMLKLKPEKITGIDLSEKMLDVGRKKIAKKNQGKKIEFFQGDSENLNFLDNSFDAVTCAFGVRNFENLDLGLSEMYRVLKKDSKVVILEFSQPKNKFVSGMYNLYFKKILPFIGNSISKDKNAYTYLPDSVSNFSYGNNFLNHLSKSGFKNTNFKTLTFGIASIYIGTK